MASKEYQDVGHIPLKTADPYEQQDQNRASTFGIAMADNDSEDGLLDYQQCHNLRKQYFLGVDVSACVDCRWLTDPHWPQSDRRRKLLTMAGVGGAVLVLILIIVAASATAAKHPRSTIQKSQGEITPSSTVQSSPTAAVPSSPATQPEPTTPQAPATPDHIEHSAYCDWDSLYLPTVVIPEAYNLTLRVPLEVPFQVTGHVHIKVNLTESVDCIVLHAEALNITSISIMQGTTSIKGHTHKPIQKYQQVVLHFSQWLDPEAGPHTLHLDFEYPLQVGVDGLYKSIYTGEDGSSQVLASTQFESIAARKALPCFDETRLKARFAVSLETPPPPVVALSNMPRDSLEDLEGGWVRHTYLESPPMSPYLLAFVVGNLTRHQVQCSTRAGLVPVSAWGTAARQLQLGVAPRVACAAVQRMEALTGVEWMLPKLDLVAIPEFEAGAMENWGLITYKEVDVLVDQTVDDLQQRFDVAATVAHEVAHQWFGDLVTCSDWTELWLNEGFATYFENAGADAFIPKYRYWDFFYNGITSLSLNDDAMSTSHPLSLRKPLAHLASVDNLFDSVMYEKGGAVLRMLRAYLNRFSAGDPDTFVPGSSPGSGRKLAGDDDSQGEPEPQKDVFLAGLQRYLQALSFSSATYKQLWGFIGEAADESVPEYMNTWTLRKNYPLLTLTRDDTGNLTVRQEPFTTRPPVEDKNGPPAKCTTTKDLGSWWVPLSWRTKGFPPAWQPFGSCEATLQGPVIGEEEYVLLNAGRYGFYRVNYDDENWLLLAQAAASLQPEEEGFISDVDFAGLLDDSFRLSEADKLDIDHFLDLTAALGRRLHEDVYSSWAVATAQLSKVLLLLRTAGGADAAASCSTQLQSYLRENVTGAYIANMRLSEENKGISFRVGVNEPVHVRRLRPLLLSAAAKYGDAAPLAAAKRLLKRAAANNGTRSIHPDVRAAVYNLAVMSGDESAYEDVLQMYLKEGDAKEKRRLMFALGEATTAPLIQRSLELALSPAVRLADMGAFLSHLGQQGGLALNMTWELILTNTSDILARFPGGGAGTEAAYSFGRVTKALASLFVDDSLMPRLEAWAGQHANILDTTFLHYVSENMAQNALWLQRQGVAVCNWLDRLPR